MSVDKNVIDTRKTNIYQEVEANPNFPEIEEKILNTWKAESTFKQSVRGSSDFVFYDGPPFANGLPHYGHLLTGFIKDLFARYKTSKGMRVERRFGWDCHGLPAEMGAEKELGISGKVAIEEYGIDKFNEYCRSSVLKYTKEWQHYITRQARWVDFADDYRTMDTSYMESVIWAFKTLYDKGLLYESMRVMPYSWACETPVSDFETRMDNAYREKVSKAVTVAFTLKSAPSSLKNLDGDLRLLVWTTTPWTLPSNLAIAVGSDIEYTVITKADKHYIIAKDLAHKYEKEIGAEIKLVIKGSELVGIGYQPLFSYFANHENAFSILAGDFVTTEDGTGAVHIAPGFGEDDFELCKKHNIEVVCPVDNGGKFIYPVEDFIGMQVFETNDEIIKKLKANDNWIRTEQYIHNYPHCWRTDTPLIYKAVPSWYLKVTALKEQLLANNQEINWIPSHIKDGLFGKWLENCRDWSISRNRYWGCPIPIWKSDDPKYPHIEVYGSIAELETAFGVKVEDLHKPFIDSLTKPNPADPTGKSMLRRVDDVLDCWFESGSMPFAQLHYPFENRQKFEQNFPADFIVEYQAQTRGWFYTMHVLATALFGKPAFRNCICHGVILGDGGQKLSKRLKNYADPQEVFSSIGADAMRWYMMSSSVMRGQEVVIDKDAKGFKESLRTAIKPLWNAYNFFTLYANADGIKAEFSFTSQSLMDKYILSRCFKTIKAIEKALDEYDTVNATKAAEDFLEILNNWYIRRSRERFWRSTIDQDKINAYNTLYTVIELLIRSICSLLPLTTEAIYLGLNLADLKSHSSKDTKFYPSSVHLTSYPDSNAYAADEELISDMERVRDACTAALSVRNNNGIRVRQPLAKVTFIGVAEHLIADELNQLILDEINAKEWHAIDKSKIEDYALYKLQIQFPILGKRIPHRVKDIIAANKAGLWQLKNGKVVIADEELLLGEYELKLEPKPQYLGKIAALSSNDGLVLLDTDLSKDLISEGFARDVVRAVQQARKNAGLKITDKIELNLLTSDEEIKNAVASWSRYINEQTLSAKIELNSNNSYKYEELVEIEGKSLTIKIKISG
jgi:isoleucyl-tRNA synthetase